MGVLSGPGTRWELRGLRWEAPALRLVWERLHLLPVRTATGRTRAATQRQLGDRARPTQGRHLGLHRKVHRSSREGFFRTRAKSEGTEIWVRWYCRRVLGNLSLGRRLLKVVRRVLRRQGLAAHWTEVVIASSRRLPGAPRQTCQTPPETQAIRPQNQLGPRSPRWLAENMRLRVVQIEVVHQKSVQSVTM